MPPLSVSQVAFVTLALASLTFDGLSETFFWLGLSDLFQTFEDLESVVDKEAEIASIRELLGKDDAQQNDEKEPLC